MGGVAAGRSLRRHRPLALLVHFHHALAGKVEGKRRGEEGQQAVLHHRVVEHLRLALTDLLGRRVAVLELPADRGVARGDRDAAREHRSSVEHNRRAHPGHGAVHERRVGRLDVLVSLGVDVRVLGEHVDVRDLDIVEEEEAVVCRRPGPRALALPRTAHTHTALTHRIVSDLGTDITDIAPLERLVRLHVPDGDDKGVRAKDLAADDELRHDGGVVGRPAERADPPLGRGERRRVDRERLAVRVPGRGGLERADIGAVA